MLCQVQTECLGIGVRSLSQQLVQQIVFTARVFRQQFQNCCAQWVEDMSLVAEGIEQESFGAQRLPDETGRLMGAPD